MLRALSIRNVLLIEHLDLSFASGLCVLTGETGAGKSILLDALSLALGSRANTELISQGADQSTIVAEFEIFDKRVIDTVLSNYGISIGQNFTLRRVVSADGRSRAFIDDQVISVTLLRQIGGLLVEVHGQLEAYGLLDQTTHRSFVDAYGDYQDLLILVSDSFKTWNGALDKYNKAKLNIEKTAQEEAFIKHAVDELKLLDPKKNEEQELAQKRSFLMSAEKSIGILK